jgi:uncharacterized protein with PIN domain
MEQESVGREPIKFILDDHLGRLARWLHLLGFDISMG